MFKKRTLYHNAIVYQMTGLEKESRYDSFIVMNKRIVDIGNKDVLISKYNPSKMVDLKGSVVLPGIIDAHGHFLFDVIAESLFAKVFSSPLGDVSNIKDVIDSLRKHDQENDPFAIIGYGFDDTKVDEFRFPDRYELDEISKDKPVVLIHQSFHLMSVNSKALEMSGITVNSEIPEGGVAYKDESGEFTGMLEEGPAINNIYVGVIVPYIKKIRITKLIKEGSDIYLKQGITTANEGAARVKQIPMLKICSLMGKLKLNLIVNTIYESTLDLAKYKKKQWKYSGKNQQLFAGPMKIFTDGSIQGYTAYLKEPYFKQHKTRSKDSSYKGYLTIKPADYENTVNRLKSYGIQYAVHANGDAAIQLVVDTEKKFTKSNMYTNIIIHCQTAEKEQLIEMKEYNMTPSFFPVHTYIWGKLHKDIYLGQKRAEKMNPLNTAMNLGLKYTIHSDSPVTPVNPWLILWSAVSRKDVNGDVLGAEERISVYDALLAMTNYAAEQYCMSDRGTISKGKYADFIVLDRNPMELKSLDDLRFLEVQQTYVNGRLLFNNSLGK